MESDRFFESESGLYLPSPDGKRVPFIGVDGGPGIGVEWDGTAEGQCTAQDCAKRIDAFLDTPEQWLEFKDPVQGESVLLSRYTCERVTFVGYTWVDLETVRAQRAQQQLARLQAMGKNPHPAKIVRAN